MARKKFRLPVKVDTLLYILFIGGIALALGLPSVLNKDKHIRVPPPEGIFPRVTAYDLFFNIDPARQVFQSRQVISLVNSNTSRRALTFLIHPDLVIDHLGFADTHASPLEVSGWRFDQPVSYMRLYGSVVLNTIIVQFTHEIAPHQALSMELEYHLKPAGYQTGTGRNFYGLFISPLNQRSIGFDSGAFPVIESNGAAPLKITIQYPDSELCGIPGQLVSSETSPGFITSTYQAVRAYDPAFSCAAYQIEQSLLDGIGVEFYLTPDQVYRPAMAEAALAYFKLYRQLFGDPGLNTFRFVYVPTELEGGGAESKGNTLYLGKQNNADIFANFDQDVNVKNKFIGLVGHEEFHDWNAYYGAWSGSLAEWWTEGGANFMSAWAGEMLWGEPFGRALRAKYSANYNAQMPYLFPGTLESPGTILKGDTWKGESTLTYDYGALVWEQLRQKVGDEALKAGLSDFIQESSQQPGTYADFIRCLQRHTSADVYAYLAQWVSHNARIDLSLKRVTIQPEGSQSAVVVIISVAGDKDYELFTSLGYKTATSPDWIIVPLHLTGRADFSIQFISPDRPTEFQVDPDYRVPQTIYNNDNWPPLGANQ
jgi:hypothetical protein